MNDRFKFRVWSEEDCGYMESNDIFRLNHSGKLVFNNDSLSREPECNPKRYICEQCTGLKDKNGKLIYEGDILNSLYRSDGCEGLYRIVWCEGRLLPEKIGNHQQKQVTIHLTDLKWCEVIGNIHKNPELLEVQDD